MHYNSPHRQTQNIDCNTEISLIASQDEASDVANHPAGSCSE